MPPAPPPLSWLDGFALVIGHIAIVLISFVLGFWARGNYPSQE